MECYPAFTICFLLYHQSRDPHDHQKTSARCQFHWRRFQVPSQFIVHQQGGRATCMAYSTYHIFQVLASIEVADSYS